MMNDNKKIIKVEKHKWPDEIMKEKKARRQKFLIVLACILCFVGGIFVSTGLSGSSSSPIASSGSNITAADADKYQEISDILSTQWYFGKDIDDIDSYLMEKAINGIANENESDEHTQYMNPESASSLMTSLSGSLTGIGIQYYQMNDSILVEKVYIDSPAEESGMKEGDIILKVDGVDIAGKEIDEIKTMITGESGTKVTVQVKRGSDKIDIEMTRAKVSVSAYGYIRDGVGVLELSSFSDNSAEEIQRYLDVFKDKKVKNIVIDLRDNGGGYVNTAIDIAGLFVGSDKVVLYQEDKKGDITSYTTGNVDKTYEFDSMSILVNQNTASASELLTAALKEHIGASVVGVKTYGKGTVQNSVTFADESIFKFTIAEWLTPSKEKIHKVGITPDYEVKLDDAVTYGSTGDENSYKVDSVGSGVGDMQMYLSFLGYNVDRKDGYFSQTTLDAVKQFQKDQGLEDSGEITPDLVSSAVSAAARKWHDGKDTLDTQMLKALEVVSGK